MKYKRIIFISLLLSLIGLMCLNAISQELPFLMDLAQLKLEVTNTEVVDHISSFNTTLSAKEGDKLFVVTLKGTVTDPCLISIETGEFSAIYEREFTNNNGEKETTLFIRVSDAIAKGDGWLISEADFRIVFTYCMKEPGPIIIKVAFILPEEITNFFVRYPALAKGKATIPVIPTTIPDLPTTIPDLPTTIPDLPTTITIPDIDITIPDITIPDITIPDITIPDITIPDITIPDITIPDIDLTMPDIKIPDIPTTIPMPTIPVVPTTIPIPKDTEEVTEPSPTIQSGSLSTGIFLVKKLSEGYGELKIENGRDLDAVGVLASSREPKIPLIAVYIKSKDSFTVEGIKDDIYTLYFTLGDDWDSDMKKFTRKTTYARFEDQLEFKTTRTATETRYTVFTVTLHPVTGGAAETKPVSEADFPELE